MNKKSKAAILVFSCLALGFSLLIFLKNNFYTTPTKYFFATLQRETTNLNDGEQIPLSKLTNFAWDYVFYTGYYAGSHDPVKEAIKRGIINVDIKEYSGENHYFADAEEGLVFLDVSKKRIITIDMSQILNGTLVEIGKKEAACLQQQTMKNNQRKYQLADCKL